MDKPNDVSVVQINEHLLDKECIRLPTDYLRHAYQAADAKRDVDEAKAALEVLEAELGQQMRKDPEKFGLEKVTEGVIREALTLMNEHKKASRKLRDAKHTADMASAVVWALDIKKKSLENLIQLHGMSYFSNPKMSKRDRDEVNTSAMKRMTRRANRED